MITLKNILVGVDFSVPSDIAMRYGRGLAEAFDASLHLLHVMEDVVAHAWAAEVYVAALPGLHEEMEKAARERLDQLLTAEETEKLRAKVSLRTGTAFVEIIGYAKSENVDLIVLGTHGRGAIAHMMLGSVAEKVVRKAPCPVLTVRESQHGFVMP